MMNSSNQPTRRCCSDQVRKGVLRARQGRNDASAQLFNQLPVHEFEVIGNVETDYALPMQVFSEPDIRGIATPSVGLNPFIRFFEIQTIRTCEPHEEFLRNDT
jgi:hypothetical protein